jgi:predicted nucleotidyltransferase
MHNHPKLDSNTSSACAGSIMELELPNDYKEFLKLLNDAEVEYLIVGGYAVAYHGYPRATEDIDVWVGDDPANIKRLIGALEQFGFRLPELEQWAGNPEKILRMGYPPMRIEVMACVSGVSFDSAARNAIVDTWNGVTVKIIGFNDLCVNKQAAGRYKDLDDLENLRKREAGS